MITVVTINGRPEVAEHVCPRCLAWKEHDAEHCTRCDAGETKLQTFTVTHTAADKNRTSQNIIAACEDAAAYQVGAGAYERFDRFPAGILYAHRQGTAAGYLLVSLAK